MQSQTNLQGTQFWNRSRMRRDFAWRIEHDSDQELDWITLGTSWERRGRTATIWASSPSTVGWQTTYCGSTERTCIVRWARPRRVLYEQVEGIWKTSRQSLRYLRGNPGVIVVNFVRCEKIRLVFMFSDSDWANDSDKHSERDGIMDPRNTPLVLHHCNEQETVDNRPQ